MSQKKNHKRNASLALAALAISGALAGWVFLGQGAGGSQNLVLAEFSGVSDAAHITGQIIVPGQNPVALNVDDVHKGQTSLSAQTISDVVLKGTSGKGKTYKMAIQDGARRVNLDIVQDASDRVHIKGSGLEPFSKIVIDTASGPRETSSDWAGLFAEDNIRPDNRKPFQVALYKGLMNDGRGNRLEPYVVNIVLTVGTVPGGQYFQDLVRNYVRPLRLMAEQFTVLMWKQALVIGQFIDAKEQLEAQRTMAKLKAEAVKDYHPSNQMCRIGSYVKSLATTEAKSDYDLLALNKTLMDYYTNKKGAASQLGYLSSSESDLIQYRNENCDPSNNNRDLSVVCDQDQDGDPATGKMGANDPERMNADISFTSTLDLPYTLDIDFTDNVSTADEQDVLSLAKNLFWKTPFDIAKDLPETNPDEPFEADQRRALSYLKARRVMAMSNMAHNSFVNIVAQKSRAPVSGIANPGWSYMKTMLREFGMTDEDIAAMVGAQPSYYAQMDILSKKIYQSPNFYTNLYDKPANVDRILASMQAIQLMQQRDQYNSMLRKEMLVSGLLEEAVLNDLVSARGTALNARPAHIGGNN